MFKINNINNLGDDNNYKLKRNSKIGVILSIISAGVIASSFLSVKDKNDKVHIPITNNISISDINDMNIILNDSNCSDALFNDICSVLRDDGINFTTTSDCVDINKENSTVITLDQQYSSGSDTLIFAPYSNTRLGNSDSLALAMRSAFDQNGFFVSDILCSQMGFEEDQDGNINYVVATDTEKAIEDDKDTSFVTISFGTNNVNALWAAKSIENGLARQNYYLNNYDSNNDLVYSANPNDSIDEVAKYFGTSKNKLITYNNVKNDTFTDSQGIVNPHIEEYDVFDKNNIFEIDNIKTRAY